MIIRYVVSGRWIWDRDAAQYYAITTTNLKQEVRDYVYTFMNPVEYNLTESIAESDFHSSTNGKEDFDNSEDEDECQ